MRRLCLLPLLLPCCCSPPRRHAADITAFLGRTTTPSSRARRRGLAIGTGLLIVGFEFEYAATDEDLDVLAGADSSRRR